MWAEELEDVAARQRNTTPCGRQEDFEYSLLGWPQRPTDG